MKLVRRQSRPISGDSGLHVIRSLVEKNRFTDALVPGRQDVLNHREAYINHLLSYIDLQTLGRQKIVANPGNGGAGKVIEFLADKLPIEFVKVHFEADGNFPNGVPNPLLELNRFSTVNAIQESGASLGVAWDGDFDRCFLFDENGRFIEAYYIVGLLAKAFLEKSKGCLLYTSPSPRDHTGARLAGYAW